MPSPRPTTRDGWLSWAQETGRIAMSATVRTAWGEAYDRNPGGVVRQLETLRAAPQVSSLARALSASGLSGREQASAPSRAASLTRALRTVGGVPENVGATTLGGRRGPRR